MPSIFSLSVFVLVLAIQTQAFGSVQVPSEVEEPAPEKGGLLPDVRLSGTFWGLWGIDVSRVNPNAPSPNGANRFDVTRTYLNFEADLGRSLSLRITPDLTRVSGTEGNLDGSLALRLKYAYLTFADVLPGVSIRALMQATPYVGFSDSIWGYRVLGQDYLELFTGISSSDLGVGVLGSHLGKTLEYQVLLSNGAGYSKPESSSRTAAKYKDIATRITFSPFAQGNPAIKGLRLTGFGQYGLQDKIADQHLSRARALGLLSWQHSIATLGVGGGLSWDDALEAEAPSPRVETQRSFLFTSWGWVDLPLNLRAIGRFDLFHPNAEGEASVGQQTRLIAGLAYRFTDDVQVIADWQRNDVERENLASETLVGSALFLHLAANF